MIKVLTSGFLTTIQDLGRSGFATIGVPISGAMDQYSAKLANAILHNNENDAVLEITQGHCQLAFDADTVICVSGADFSVSINTVLIRLNTIITIKKGDVLSFGKPNYGVRTYVAVLGGFQTKKTLNSRSYYKGITEVSLVKKGAFLPFKLLNNTVETSFSSVKINQKHFNSTTINCYKGPEFDLLSAKQQIQLLQSNFTVSSKNNRMAYQLNEPVFNDLKDVLTSSVLPGTVQLTPSGTLIVLMRDCQVTGGYPRVLILSDQAINQLAQKNTGNSLFFNVL